MKKKKVYTRVIKSGNIKLFQIIFFNLVITLYKAGVIDGGDNRYHLSIKKRKGTNL